MGITKQHVTISSSTPFATKPISSALAIPSKWLNMYGDFITKNASAVSQIESGLRSLTYIIPGHYRDSEVASESLHSGIQLLSLYHDTLLTRAISSLPASKRPHQSPHNRYTKYWTSKSSLYQRVATLLQMIKYTELLWEMAAKRRRGGGATAETMRWRVVVFLEMAKAVCRLLLLRLTGSRPLVSPPLPERDVDPGALEEPTPNDEFTNGTTTTIDGSSDEKHVEVTRWTMPRTGLTLPTLPSPTTIPSYLLSHVLTADDIKAPNTLLTRIHGTNATLAELLYILRPVIYALALYRYRHDKKNWKPWMLGFAMEYGARQLAKADVRERRVGGLRGLSGLEKEELRRRGWGLGWWVLRGAFYENITRSWIHSIAGAMRGKLLLDLVANIVDDYEFLWDEYYFPTATL